MEWKRLNTIHFHCSGTLSSDDAKSPKVNMVMTTKIHLYLYRIKRYNRFIRYKWRLLWN